MVVERVEVEGVEVERMEVERVEAERWMLREWKQGSHLENGENTGKFKEFHQSKKWEPWQVERIEVESRSREGRS